MFFSKAIAPEYLGDLLFLCLWDRMCLLKLALPLNLEVLAARYPPSPMAIDPAAISANPAVTTTIVVWAAPDNPAARAKGTVSPSDMPITISRTVSLAIKYLSTCGVAGIIFS
jgi:hypothetical protein